MELPVLWEYANLYLNGIPTYRLRKSKTGIWPKEVLRLYQEALDSVPHPEPKSISLSIWNEETACNHKYRQVIESLKRQFSGLSGTLILMGSLADGTATGYSDLDAAYFPPDEEFVESFGKIRQALRKAARVILSFDHLQHHGVFVIPKSTARICSPLPPSAFHKARVLQGEKELILGAWETSWKANLKPIINKCITLAENPEQRPRNLYGIKLFLSQIMLLPSLFLLARGQDVPKADSFGMVKGMFREDCGALDVATELRASWKRLRSRFFEIGVKTWPSPWDFAFAFRRFFGPPGKIIAVLNDGFYGDAGRLARRMKDALDI